MGKINRGTLVVIVFVIGFQAIVTLVGFKTHRKMITSVTDSISEQIATILSIEQKKQLFIQSHLDSILLVAPDVPREDVIEILSAVYDIAIQKYSLDGALVLSIIHNESTFNKNAHSKINKDDDYNGRGLYQIIPLTAAWIANKLGWHEYDLYDIRTNIEMGSYYLSGELEEYGERKALALWYAGSLLKDEKIRAKADSYYQKIITTKKKYEV
jgi:hypothetical protein